MQLLPAAGLLPILRAGNIGTQLNLEDDLVYVPATYVTKEQLLKEGDIAICMSSGSATVVGKTAQLLRPWRGSVGAFCGIVRPSEVNSADWLGFWFRSREFRDWRDSQARGANIQNLRFSQFAGLQMPWPPDSEQRRIAGILKEQMAEVEQARKATEAQLEAARALPAAYLREVFESEEAKNWPRKKIGDVAKVQSGYAFKSEWFVESGIRLLRNANVFQGHLAWDDVVYLSNSRRGEFEDYELQKGDVILSLDRPVVKNGLKVARVTDNDLPSLLLQRVGRFRITGGVLPEFLYSFLQTPRFIRAITGHDQSLGVPHVSPGQVEDVEIPIPPIPVQHQTVAMVREQTANAEKLLLRLKCKEDGAEQEGATDVVDKLPAALLRRAFSGDI